MIPQISSLNFSEIKFKRQPSHTYKISGDRIEGFLDGAEALKQTIFHILSTDRYAYPIYDSNYGNELKTLFNKSTGFVIAGLGQVITDALLQDDRIESVIVNQVEVGETIDSVVANFTVISKEGIFTMEGVFNDKF